MSERGAMTATVEPDDLTAEVNAEIAKLAEEGKLEVRVNQKCRVCSDEPTRMLVNNLLARLHSYQDIFLILDSSVNPARRDKGERPITRRIIKTHAEGHFDIDHPARAVWRAIGLKRAAQLKRDYVEGVGGVVTHLAFMETVMQRGFEHLVDPETSVNYMDGMKAAVQLAEIETKTQGEQRHAEMLAEMNRLITVVKETVSPELWPVIIARVTGGPDAVRQLPAGPVVEAEDEDDDEFDPGDDHDYDDDDA